MYSRHVFLDRVCKCTFGITWCMVVRILKSHGLYPARRQGVYTGHGEREDQDQRRGFIIDANPTLPCKRLRQHAARKASMKRFRSAMNSSGDMKNRRVAGCFRGYLTPTFFFSEGHIPESARRWQSMPWYIMVLEEYKRGRRAG